MAGVSWYPSRSTASRPCQWGHVDRRPGQGAPGGIRPEVPRLPSRSRRPQTVCALSHAGGLNYRRSKTENGRPLRAALARDRTRLGRIGRLSRLSVRDPSRRSLAWRATAPDDVAGAAASSAMAAPGGSVAASDRRRALPRGAASPMPRALFPAVPGSPRPSADRW